MNKIKKSLKDKAALVPRLRFPEFLDDGRWSSEFGNMIFDQISNKDHNSDLPILAITQEQGAIPRDMIGYHVSVTNKSLKNYKVVEVGDFIISLRSFQGGIEFSRYRGICSPAYVILRRKYDHSEDYFRHYLKTDRFIAQMTKNLEGLRDGKMVSYKQFSELALPVPPSNDEQQKIADCLSSLDELIAAETQKLDALKTHKQGLMQQLFPREGETVPQLRLPEFQDAGAWKRLTIAAVCEINPSRVRKKDHELVSFIPMAAVSEDGRIEISQIRAYAEVKKGYTSFIENDVIIAKITPCFENGKAALARGLKNGTGFGSTEFHVFRAHKPCLPEFLFLQLHRDAVRIEGARSMVGNAGQRRVPASFFATFPFYLPTAEEQQTEEQQAIVEFLFSLDTLLTSQTQKIDALQTHKKGLMQQLFPMLDEVSA